MVRLRLLLSLAALLLAGCKERDPATLPHVDRPWGNVQPGSVAWASKYQLEDAMTCYDRALDWDPTQRGTITLTATRPNNYGGIDIAAEHTGTLSPGLVSCFKGALIGPGNVDVHSPEKVTLSLEPEMRHEPTPPGDFAFRNVIERMLKDTPVRVLSVDVRREGEVRQLGKRVLNAKCTAKIEVLRDYADDWCGELRPPGGPQCRGKGEGCECAKVERKRGEQLELSSTLSFVGHKNGWHFSYGHYEDPRHFFGDETVGD